MICGTCKKDVHPLKVMDDVASCAGCGAPVDSNGKMENAVRCGSCGRTGAPSVRPAMVDKCPRVECGAMMPTAVAAVVPAPPRLAQSAPKQAAKQSAPSSLASVGEGLRVRLAEIEALIDNLETLKEEAATIRRMIAVMKADGVAAVAAE